MPQTIIEDYVEEKKIIYLPLRSIDCCSVCGKTSPPLRLCSSCGEKVYCSSYCQTKDWSDHRSSCGKTDRVNLAAFYPFLACLAEDSHVHIKKPRHIARKHSILNFPADIRPVAFPDGSAATLLILGNELPEGVDDPDVWWPTATSPDIRSKLLNRIQREGYTLQLTTSICIGLLRGMYTTTFVRASDDPYGRARRRVRLQYKQSPIADFGIIRGIAHVRNQDRLAYFRTTDGFFEKGQNPDRHHWLYFTTLSGEDATLDCGTYTFNSCTCVRAESYRDSVAIHARLKSAPACFLDLKSTPNASHFTTPHQKFSVLHNEALHKAVQDSAPGVNWESVLEFMESISGVKCTEVEGELSKFWTLDSCGAMEELIQKRTWESWSAEPVMETEPNEAEAASPPLDGQDWAEYIKEWNDIHDRRLSLEAFDNAYKGPRCQDLYSTREARFINLGI